MIESFAITCAPYKEFRYENDTSGFRRVFEHTFFLTAFHIFVSLIAIPTVNVYLSSQPPEHMIDIYYSFISNNVAFNYTLFTFRTHTACKSVLSKIEYCVVLLIDLIYLIY